MTKEEMVIDICEVLSSPLDEIYFKVLSNMSLEEVTEQWLKLFDPN